MKEKIMKFVKSFDNIDKKIMRIMNYGFLGSIMIGIIGILTLLFYNFSYISYDLIEASILLFQAGLLFTIQIFVCGYTVNLIRN